MRRLPFLLLTLVLLAACDSAGGDPASDGPTLRVHLTTGDGAVRLQEQDAVAFRKGNALRPARVALDDAATFQTIEGFGAAMTNASAYVIHHSPQRDEILRRLFSADEGIALSYVRVPMGASDFTAQPAYTYLDLPPGQTDPALAGFSIAADRPFILPVLRSARALNPALRFMASPWSAPAWMKNPAALGGGGLRTTYYGAYAQYFVRFLQAYAEEGIPIDAVTVQNEPRHTTDSYPTMRMEPAEQAAFIGEHLGPALEAAGLSTKILAWDHNWDAPDYPLTVLADARARAYVDGVAWHCYAGDVAAQSRVHDAYPGVGTYFTECSGGAWDNDFGSVLSWNLRNLFIGGTRHHARTVLLWNLALDEQHGPHRGGCDNCRGVVTVPAAGGYRLEPEYYVLGHFSRFVPPGAVRLGTTATGGLEAVGFRNPDGSRALVVLNPGATAVTFDVAWQGQVATPAALPPRSVVTLTWREG